MLGRLALAALLTVAVSSIALALAVRGAFAAPDNDPISERGSGPLMRVDDGIDRGAAGRGRVALVWSGERSDAARRASELLASRGVTATFAVTAEMVLADPQLACAIVRSGHEVALAGVGPRDVAALPAPLWRATETAAMRLVEGAAGRTVHVFAEPRTLIGPRDRASAELVERAHDVGLIAVGAAPSPRSPLEADGLIVLRGELSGADVDSLLALLTADRVTVVPAAELAGVGPDERATPPSLLTTAFARTVLAGAGALEGASDLLAVLTVVVSALVLARLIVVVGLAAHHARRAPIRHVAGKVAVLVPAYNEEVSIAAGVRAALASDHPDLEVVVIDDGSTDRTAEVVAAIAREDPRVRVLRRPNRGKAQALNAGLAAVEAPFLVVADADSVIEPEAVRRLLAPFADPAVGATAGNVKVGNRGSLLGAMQHVEYVMGINLDRRFFDVVDAVSVVPGALGAFRRSVVEEAGGFPDATLAEDADLTVTIGVLGYRVRHVPAARTWTEAPDTWRGLYKQRFRWAYGTLQVLWKHRSAPLRRGSTNVARLGLLYIVLFGYALPLLAPAIDVALFYGILGGRTDLVAPFALFNVLQFLAAAIALGLDGEPRWHAAAVLLHQLGFRQLLSYAVASSLWAALSGIPVGWGKLVRRGLPARA